MKTTRNFILLPAILLFLSQAVFSQQPNLPLEKTALIYGANLKYFEAGQGPAVILLHGLGAVKEVWLSSLVALSDKYHVYAIDQIGFGHSDKPLLDYKITTFVDFLHGFMQSQNLGKATLVGNSLGGWIALDFVARHPEMVDKLVLVDSAGLPWSGTVNVPLNPSTVAEQRAVLESIFYNKQFVTDAFVLQAFSNHVHNNDGYTIHSVMAGFSSAQFEDGNLKSIKAPTLIFWGRQDELIPTSDGEKMHDGITGSKLVVLDQCGHFPEVEKAADFNRELLEFLGH
jgi:pimeloyl-ACP methyl ester carboxylesterase